ncbi:hypothetical protein K523DRAFT_223009, partial [Schizophyllum commune Tattone D]
NAIIDTGSQLNVLNEKLMHSLLSGKTIDMENPTRMKDANGGDSVLLGVARDVEVMLGKLPSLTDIHIGTNVPFDLLLGRPWQRGNKISIEERDNGTTLVIPDP